MSSRLFMLAATVLTMPCGPAHAGPAAVESSFPTDTIQNEHLTMVLFTPDFEKGYYRGSRFDWSGIIERVEFAGHRIFGRFSDKTDATVHDRVMGPCEEFGMDGPNGFEEAAIGGTFAKIGVGELVKNTDEYRFFKPFAIRDPAPWQISRARDRIAYTQELFTPGGWCYSYTKVVALNPAAPGFTIQHTLCNTGWHTIDTTHYNHGFYIVDDDPIGPNYEVEFLADVSLGKAENLAKAGVRLEGRKLVFEKPLYDMWSEVLGSKGAETNGFVVRHKKSGVTIRIKGDQPPVQFNLWGNSRALCPEPFAGIHLEPGESMRWTIEFRFSKD
jgi:hypothetical protein